MSYERYINSGENVPPGYNDDGSMKSEIKRNNISKAAKLHIDKCCTAHGCIFNDPFCPVVKKEVKQIWQCDKCHD